MADVPSQSRLAPAASQLPVTWYFDHSLFALEQRVLFAGGPGYVGHESMVPGAGDYHTLGWMDEAMMLLHNSAGVELLSNICRHRQAIMLEGRGNAKTIVCPIHRWSYDTRGKLLGAPHFPANPCLHLERESLRRWNGLLFRGPRDPAVDLADIDTREFDFSAYRFDRVVETEHALNWKTFIEVYLEDYHVAPSHPGLGNFVSCRDLQWRFGEWHSVQRVGVKRNLQQPGTRVYERWHRAVLDYYAGRMPPFGAVWFVYYPNVMIELYPHSLVISTAIPRSPTRTTNVIEFYYPEEILRYGREFVEAEQAAYLETAVEDDLMCQRIERGRRALRERGVDMFGPYQSPMEDGMQHFHEFLRRRLTPHL